MGSRQSQAGAGGYFPLGVPVVLRKYTSVVALLVVFAISRGLLSADETPPDWNFKSAKANEATRKYQVACKKLANEYARQQAENRTALIEKLQENFKAATRNNDLDDALAIRGLITAIQKAPNPGQPAKDGSGPKKPVTIPATARKFKGHHYLFSPMFLDLAAAKQACEKAGGYLVRIESAEEQAVVRTLLTGRGAAAGRSWREDAFIDGSDEKKNGV